MQGGECSKRNGICKIINGKTDRILAFHGEQSFKEGEVTPELAHEIGVRLANEMWGDRFQVVVTTHLNTDHIHNHFVLNSVSFKDGKSIIAIGKILDYLEKLLMNFVKNMD